ncbi:tRNA dihydrouridine synthase [Coemansia sp. RSA 1813]|nr:tRNA dihydrouridine synthase [Coemansia sp. RSA 1646]KAJ1770091.1 tRNA dihydrouridine synthase [Coemansia sp. RSA 1843]KAJ2089871.1 tRNA dihydrouridine synthase [Coemansia sp. RSA 986]KAJ2214744.1 tRNA dihydrouridine synthase [Coemansia sp. RSA 487]KAJ2569731.1 tRNA dihydrouridine synthase [Coemansia sp. RSA 1813]
MVYTCKRQSILQLFEEKPRLNVCAPMVRYSKGAFREILRDYNVDIAYTPMILADVFKSSEHARRDFTTNDTDCPVVVQFAAHDPVDLAHAAQIVAPFADGIDLNCGCPQKWAYKERIGAYLSDRPELVQDMVRTVKAAIDMPCSIKIRKHPTDVRKTVELAKRAEMMGVDWIAVHGRTRHQKSSEPLDYNVIRLVKESVRVPVIANGSIFSLKDAETMYEQTGVSGVMAARGLLQNPAFFAGYEFTPLECVERYVNRALAYGTPTFILHHHIMYMMESLMSNVERKTFNCLSSTPAILDHLFRYYGIRSKY